MLFDWIKWKREIDVFYRLLTDIGWAIGEFDGLLLFAWLKWLLSTPWTHEAKGLGIAFFCSDDLDNDSAAYHSSDD